MLNLLTSSEIIKLDLNCDSIDGSTVKRTTQTFLFTSTLVNCQLKVRFENRELSKLTKNWFEKKNIHFVEAGRINLHFKGEIFDLCVIVIWNKKVKLRK